MGKPTWCTPSPLNGAGDGMVNINGTAHTGRSPRTGTLTYKASGVADVAQTVTQSGKPQFVTVNNVSAPKEGGNVTITGRSNTDKLFFTLGGGDIALTLPPTYLAGGASTGNNAAIAGDPGASAEFDFAVTFVVPSNKTIHAKTRTIVVVAAGGQAGSSTITQAAGDPALSVTPNAVTLNASGEGISVTVTSNTNWTVE